MTALVDTVSTADGPFTLVVDRTPDGEVVLASGWTNDLDAVISRIGPAARPESMEAGETDAGRAVIAYYDGDLTAIDRVPVRQIGGAFRTVAWQALRDIPAGRPLTYSEFAQRLGNPKAVRAAAGACASNAPALFVPCHRVLRTDGSLGGFAWGLDVKRSLLAREATAAI
ncbi:methylated-DNA--[protein]-cysteine S-methyltransferase [Nakamurella leprariae]|uniref:Methylated-DNA--[protein]-cysteine S-methyltransferase n=1 Tax=Nakamurella leprariae TaxID=2803911 RepID=A0A938YBC0_9ACTN|nr:methylated-DNA--[protein]-cysteine S-methyltransferase [Nakamurella leprariae]MBM9466461.1 methylated-DNA--[protein]-cysteine S-methyltransferase [Nakamurella leprariae]